jgi:uncharacterized protein (TIGR03437 family)
MLRALCDPSRGDRPSRHGQRSRRSGRGAGNLRHRLAGWQCHPAASRDRRHPPCPANAGRGLAAPSLWANTTPMAPSSGCVSSVQWTQPGPAAWQWIRAVSTWWARREPQWFGTTGSSWMSFPQRVPPVAHFWRNSRRARQWSRDQGRGSSPTVWQTRPATWGGGVAPGEIVTLFGSAMGPSELVPLRLTDDPRLATALAETRIPFNGVPAPLLYVSDKQSSAIVPYAVTGKSSVDVQVEHQGVRSEAVTVPVLTSRPGISGQDGSRQGQGAILNEDGSPNSPSNPAQRGSIITLYVTGEESRPQVSWTARSSAAFCPGPACRCRYSLTSVFPILGGNPKQAKCCTPEGYPGRWPACCK